MAEIESVLKLEKLVFDKILFERHGFKNDLELKMNMQVRFSQKQENGMYLVVLILKGMKPNEYDFEINLSGYFSFATTFDLTEEQKKDIIGKNTVAIMMPYMRSQVSLLTAQPEVDCVVLPPFNVAKMFEKED